MEQQLQKQFREDEIITMVHWDKQIGVQVTTPYPNQQITPQQLFSLLTSSVTPAHQPPK